MKGQTGSEERIREHFATAVNYCRWRRRYKKLTWSYCRHLVQPYQLYLQILLSLRLLTRKLQYEDHAISTLDRAATIVRVYFAEPQATHIPTTTNMLLKIVYQSLFPT